MALRKPLVIISGLTQQLPTGDTLDAAAAEVDVIALTNGVAGAQVIGTPVYISAGNTFSPAQANAAASQEVLGLVKDPSIAAAASGNVQTDGIITATTAQWDAVTGATGGLVPNSPYYLNPTTAGRLTATAPTTTGQYVKRVGLAISTTAMDISVYLPVLL